MLKIAKIIGRYHWTVKIKGQVKGFLTNQSQEKSCKKIIYQAEICWYCGSEKVSKAQDVESLIGKT